MSEPFDREQLGRAQAVAVVAALARSFEAAHQRAVVHGTFAPAEVLVDQAGGLIGIAPPPAAREEVDLLLHAAPEVLAGGAPSAASDVWGLGVLLYLALTGRTPFESSGAWCLDRSTRAALEPSPPSWFEPGVDRRLEAICLGCLHLSPALRPSSAAVARVLSSAAPVVPMARYTVKGELGRGGMGRVLRAHDRLLGRDVALKEILLEPGAGDFPPGLVARFQREVLLLTRLDHPNVVRILDAGLRDRSPYLTMDLVEGSSLQAQARYGLSTREVARIMAQVARGLHHAHERGVLHRDLKPENVLVRRDGRAFLSDFGVARSVLADHQPLTAPGRTVGTPAFFSPEQVVDPKRIDARSDVWTLGVTIWAALTRGSPFQRASLGQTLQAIMQGTIPALRQLRKDVDPVLEAIVMRCLQRDPARRWASAAEVAEELEELPAIAALRASPVHPTQRGPEDVWGFEPAEDDGEGSTTGPVAA